MRNRKTWRKDEFEHIYSFISFDLHVWAGICLF